MEVADESNNEKVEEQQKMKRPSSITIVAILSIIFGSIVFIMGWMALTSQHLEIDFQLLNAYNIMWGLIAMIIAYGLLRARSWAWKSAIALYLLNILISILLVAISEDKAFTFGSRFLAIIISIAIIYDFTRLPVKMYFNVLK